MIISCLSAQIQCAGRNLPLVTQKICSVTRQHEMKKRVPRLGHPLLSDCYAQRINDPVYVELTLKFRHIGGDQAKSHIFFNLACFDQDRLILKLIGIEGVSCSRT